MTMKVRYTTIDGEVIAENRNGVYKTYVPDPLGSTVAMLDKTQTQTDTFSYWPYGEVNTRTGITPTPFQFVGTRGYFQDSASKTYVRARYQDTQKARWLNQDPIGFNGRDWNTYRYALGRPVSFSDPSGLDVWICCAYVLGVPGHCFLSTTLGGAWGSNLNHIPPLGLIENDDPYLRYDPGSGSYVPGQGAPGMWIIISHRCRKVSSDPGMERRLLKCIDNGRGFWNTIWFPIYFNCQNWVGSMLDCACGPGQEWGGSACQPASEPWPEPVIID